VTVMAIVLFARASFSTIAVSVVLDYSQARSHRYPLQPASEHV